MKLSEMVSLAKTCKVNEYFEFAKDEEDFNLACDLTGFEFPFDSNFLAGFVAGVLAERKSRGVE